MKIMKKSLNIILSVALLLVTFATPVYNVHAQTLGDLKRELQAKEDEYNKKENEKKLTEDEKKKVESDIKENSNKLVKLSNDKNKLSEDIVNLNKSIETRHDEIKKVMNYNQLSNGESSTLEYIFGAKTFTDFIYRASIAEQLSKYNKDLIDKNNEDIKLSKEKQVEIGKKQVEINEIQKKLDEDNQKLGEKIEQLSDDMLTASQQIKIKQQNIITYQNTYKCSDNESLDSCKAKALKNSNIPPSSGLWLRPFKSGRITGNYGRYDPYHTGRPIDQLSFHKGVDLVSTSGYDVYPVASGTVKKIEHNSGCGKIVVWIVHYVGSRYYTSGYYHLRSVNVEVGDIVSPSKSIGIEGGDQPGDCSTARHLHFMITTGGYMVTYTNHPTSENYFNPRDILNFPTLKESGYHNVGTSDEWTTR